MYDVYTQCVMYVMIVDRVLVVCCVCPDMFGVFLHYTLHRVLFMFCPMCFGIVFVC